MIKTIFAAVLVFLCHSMLFAQEAGPATVTPTDMTVYGMRLGEKFTVPECKRAPACNVLGQDYETVVTSRCFVHHHAVAIITKPNTPVTTEEVGIMFPFNDTPQLMMDFFGAFNHNLVAPIVAQVIDGNIETVTIYTYGLQFQDAMLATLKEKYGEPTNIEEEEKGNALGAVFSSHKATWDKLTGLTVLFYGTLDRTDIGSIDIWTDKGADYLSKRPKPQVGPKL